MTGSYNEPFIINKIIRIVTFRSVTGSYNNTVVDNSNSFKNAEFWQVNFIGSTLQNSELAEVEENQGTADRIIITKED